MNEDVRHPICPFNMYFEGEEEICDVNKCDYDFSTRGCCSGCRKDKTPEASILQELLDALFPFADAANAMEWEFTKDYFKFYPVNSRGNVPILAKDMRIALDTYNKYAKRRIK